MLAVVSSSMRSSFIFPMASAATWMALIPASGLTPAWEDFPKISTFSLYCPGAARIIFPGAPLLSSTTARLAVRRL